MRLLNTCYGNKYSLIWREKNEKTYWIDIICSNVVKDIRGLTETLVENRGSYCRITTNDVNDLEYIVGLLKEYNATK